MHGTISPAHAASFIVLALSPMISSIDHTFKLTHYRVTGCRDRCDTLRGAKVTTAPGRIDTPAGAGANLRDTNQETTT
jgi:hypothetical protein